jgi:hypothetical protein
MILNRETNMKQLILCVIVIVAGFGACTDRQELNKDPIESGGLGLSRRSWEGLYGNAHWEDSGQVLFRDEKHRYMIWFWDGNAGSIDFANSDGATMTLEAARELSQKLIPADSKFTRSEMASPQSITDYYSSESLTGRFSQSTWRDGMPGTFQIWYRGKSGPVESFVIELANK